MDEIERIARIKARLPSPARLIRVTPKQIKDGRALTWIEGAWAA